MKRPQPSGVLLLLALVMMALVLSAALVLGTVIVRELRLAQVADKGITAFYASETAAEDAVYRMFKLGEQAFDLATSGSLSGGSTWTRLAKKTDAEFVFDFVAKDETVVVNLYHTGETDQAAQVESFSMEWTSGQSLEVAVSEWDGATLATPTVQVCTSSPCISNTPRLDRGYSIYITALGAAVTDLILSTYAGDGATGAPVGVEIPVTVIATGEYQGAQQAVELRLPVPTPWEGTPVPPATQTCGNGATEGTETCDDNNTNDGDGCSSTCQIEVAAVCGNSAVESGEQCDDGNTSNGDGCSSTCQTEAGPVCGNSIIEAGEQCDDGNAANGDGCSSTCQNEVAAVLTTIVVSPDNVITAGFTPGKIAPLASQQFTAQGFDQFGNPMAIVPAPTWSRSPNGSIDSGGVYIPADSTTTFTVTATSGSISDSASGTVGCPATCHDINMANEPVQVEAPYGVYGSYVLYNAYRNYPRCGGVQYKTTITALTPLASLCTNTYPVNNCAAKYAPQAGVPIGYLSNWGYSSVGRYNQNDSPNLPTVTITQSEIRFCK